MSQALTKRPSDNRLYQVDFAEFEEIRKGETISSASVTSERITGTGTITLGATSVAGSLVQFRISGGTDGDDHRLSGSATLSGGSVIVGCGKLLVKKC